MSSQSDKEQRRRLRELAELAYERELSRELSDLEGEFSRWRSGETNAFDLSEAIHAFHQGAARELFSRYGRSSQELVVARAIHDGIISRDEVGAAMLKHLAGHLRALES
jgi:hypothetical protein